MFKTKMVRQTMKKKILIVDDEPDVRFTIKDDLEDEYNIDEVENGLMCLEYLSNNSKPDLILLDIMMPEMNGWKTIEQIRDNKSWRNIPIIFLTARTDDVAKIGGDFLGEDYIEKPYNLTDLKQRIEKVLNTPHKSIL